MPGGSKKATTGELHTVMLMEPDLWACDCKAHQYRRTCRHVDGVKSLVKEAGLDTWTKAETRVPS